MVIKCKNAEETVDAGYSFGLGLKTGDVVCLTGDLGAGKTTFTKGIAKALGSVYEPVSPTFNIVNEYPGNINLFHFDLYRLESVNDLYSLDFDSYLFGDGILVIEWPEIALSLLENFYSVEISYDGEGRIIKTERI